MKLRTFTFVSALLLATVAVTASVLLIVSTSRLRNAATSIQQSVQSVYAIEELKILLLKHHGAISVTEGATDDLRKDAQQRIDAIRTHVSTEGEHALAESTINKVFAYIEAVSDDRTGKTFASSKPTAALDYLDHLTQLNLSQAESRERVAYREDHYANYVGISMLVALCGSSVLVSLLYVKLLIRPLRSLRSAIDQFRLGRLQHWSGPSTIKEIAEIEEAFQEMAETIQRNRQTQLRFIAGVAHDIRGPLNSVSIASKLLNQKGLNAAEETEVKRVIEAQVRQLSRLTEDLLDTASIESGNLALSRSFHDLCPIVQENANAVELVHPSQVISVCLPREPVFIECDSARISQVLQNLLSNAVKYSGLGSIISVSVKAAEGKAELSVEDDGVGIAVSDQQRIFEPFQRSARTQDGAVGLGLGLSVTKHIVSAHGGTIEVKSDIGAGAMFTVRLPLSSAEALRSSLDGIARQSN